MYRFQTDLKGFKNFPKQIPNLSSKIKLTALTALCAPRPTMSGPLRCVTSLLSVLWLAMKVPKVANFTC